MIGMGVALLIYLGMHWFNVWEVVPQEHKFWVGVALFLIATSDASTKVIYREKS